METKDFDVLIIGGGPAGLSAGIYSGRNGLKTAIIEKFGTGGLLNITDCIANYPGYPHEVKGFRLGEAMQRQAEQFGTQVILDEILSLEDQDRFKVAKGYGALYRAKVVIISTGVRYKPLGVPGEEEFRGRGVSYCATCDGAFFKGKPIIVVGGGDSALQEAIYLTQFGTSVTIIHRRDLFRATPFIQEQLKNYGNIKLSMNSVVSEIRGDKFVEKVIVCNTVTSSVSELPANGVFIFVGMAPNTEFIGNYLLLRNDGYIQTDDNMRTSKSGVFAAGDIRDKEVRQVITACADGAIAAQAAWKHISQEGK